MARDGVPVGPEFAGLVARHVAGERLEVAAECRRLGASRSSFYKYVARFRAEGVDGFYPRPRRPLTTPTATPARVEDVVLRARKELDDDGWDAGADSIGFWLEDHPDLLPAGTSVPSRATINRILRRPTTCRTRWRPRSRTGWPNCTYSSWCVEQHWATTNYTDAISSSSAAVYVDDVQIRTP